MMQPRRLPLLALLVVALAGCQTARAPAPSVATVQASPSALALAPGETASLTAVARDADGDPVPNATFTWASDDTDVATVAGGTVTAVGAGVARATASAGGRTSPAVTVTVTEPAGFTIEPATSKLPVLQGSSAALTVTVTREPGFDGAVTLALAGLPSGASASPVTVAANETSATVTVRAAASAPHALPTAVALTGASGDVEIERTVTVTVRGPAGSLDTSFAGGVNRTPVGLSEDYARALAVQADKKVVVVGGSTVTGGLYDMAVVRYGGDGGLDPDFGTNGVALVPFGGNEEAWAVAVQDDGKIVIAGVVTPVGQDGEFGLARLNADGTLDTGFGAGGLVTTDFGPDSDRAYAVAIQDDGKIVVAGDSYQGSATGVDFALARYRADGALDATFGSGGKVLQPVTAGSSRDSIYDVLLQDVGGETRIVAVGGEGDYLMARFTASGALDASFGTGGKVIGVFGSTVGAAYDVAETADGALVVAGHRSHDFTLARFSADGVLDTTFGTTGLVVTPVSAGNWDEAHGLAVQSDGKLVVGGWSYPGAGSNGEFALARYGADGALDTGFGTDGVTVTGLNKPGPFTGGMAVAFQPDSRVPAVRILLAGSDADTNGDFALARYWP